ncbi:hypothetical protein WKT07_15225 [Mediterraneibacter sp. HCN-7094]
MFRVFPQSLKSKVSKNFHYHRAVISTKKENKICLLW